jgi:small subunit ribosomal protein S20
LGEDIHLPNKPAAEKAMRQNARRRTHNRVIRTTARTEIKDAHKLIAAGNLDEAEKAVRQAIRALDRAAEKGVIKKNNAARRKSRLLMKLNPAKAAKR